jgi:hypothetical protein
MKSPTVVALLAGALLLVFAGPAAAKDKETDTVLMWPNSAAPTLRVTLGKLRGLSSYGGQHDYAEDVTVENVSSKNISIASFTVYLLDKSKVRIADSILQIKDLGPGQQVKQPLQFHASGVPASVSLVARSDASGVPTSLKTIPLKIISLPSGAKLKIDGQEVGFTPYTANLRAGSHTLEFSKEGYAVGNTPLDIAPDETPGGSITFELGGLSKDTVELRDGTVLLCEVLSMSMSQITVRVAGQDQTYQRNQVKKIILVEREIIQKSVTQPDTKQ